MTAVAIHVAILDDEPSIRTALGRLLTAAGMVVEPHAAASRFYDTLARKAPDCLLLDFQMPGTSGLDVLQDLNQRNIKIPTIVMTGHDEKTSREACMNAGAAAYLLKPLDAEQLVRTIESVCARP